MTMKKNRKFLKYKEGDIEYLREDDLDLKDALDEKKKDIQNTLKTYNIKDYLVFALVLILIGGPMIFYFYYLKPVPQGDFPSKEDIAINIDKEKNLDNSIDHNQRKELSEQEIRGELIKINNENVDKLNSYFDKKSNRVGLRSVLEKGLKKQKDLYVEVELIRSEHENNSLLLLQEEILADIEITVNLIEMTKNTISKDKAEDIFSETKQYMP